MARNTRARREESTFLTREIHLLDAKNPDPRGEESTAPVWLADRDAGSGVRCFTLCLQGPPGTGKSVFVHYLAERLGLEVVQKRASDLLSMWVGETEQRVAAAFAGPDISAPGPSVPGQTACTVSGPTHTSSSCTSKRTANAPPCD